LGQLRDDYIFGSQLPGPERGSERDKILYLQRDVASVTKFGTIT